MFELLLVEFGKIDISTGRFKTAGEILHDCAKLHYIAHKTEWSKLDKKDKEFYENTIKDTIHKLYSNMYISKSLDRIIELEKINTDLIEKCQNLCKQLVEFNQKNMSKLEDKNANLIKNYRFDHPRLGKQCDSTDK